MKKNYVFPNEYTSLKAICGKTLCKPNKQGWYRTECLNRECTKCCIDNAIPCTEQELSSYHEDVSWEMYDYQLFKKNGKDCRHLQLFPKESKLEELITYYKSLLVTYPGHLQRANWQNQQLKNVKENLPDDWVVMIHDFSENYKPTGQVELQSQYYAKQEITLHVTIIHRKVGTNTVTEHFIVISPDTQHDSYFVREVQKLVTSYLRQVGCRATTLIEYTDGCSSQYKCLHCLGDISLAPLELGFRKVVRCYFETSHAKGPQDAAGGYVKRQADLASLRGQSHINSAHDLFDFAVSKLQTPKSGVCEKRVFRYIECVDRVVPRQFQPVKDNRLVHMVVTDDIPGILHLRNLTCMDCAACRHGNFLQCRRTTQIGSWRTTSMRREFKPTAADDDEAEQSDVPLVDAMSDDTVIAVVSADERNPYYLLHCDGPPENLSEPLVDSYGSTFEARTKVVLGSYNEQVEGLTFANRFPSMKAAVYEEALLNIVSTDADDHIEIDLDTNLYILEMAKMWGQ